MLKLAYNTTDSAILVDSAGYSIGGREWGAVDTGDKLATVELDSGRVVLTDEDVAKDSDNPQVRQAMIALELRREREAAAKELDKDELIEKLPPETVDALPAGASGEPSKADLVDAAVGDPSVNLEDDAAPPAKPAPKTTRAAGKK